jgi:hypothetical protein
MALPLAPARCERCAAPVVEISLARGTSKMTMSSCSACDTRRWSSDGQVLGFDSVLAAVAPSR